MKAKYNKIGINYNQTRKADKYLADKLIALLNPHPNGVYLDIGCGTGNYTNELHKRGYEIIGVDPSIEMLKEAKNNNDFISWRIGTAEKTDLPDNSITGITGFLTIHHWTSLEQGFQELHRILKKNGRIVIFTSTPKQMKGYWLNHYFPQMLSDSISQMPSIEKVEAAMLNNGFKIVGTDKYSIKPDLEDLFLYCGKHNPELYFDNNIRQGISSFSSLANHEEVTKGLDDLRKDMNNGKITQIIESFENDLGDYLYIIGEKLADSNIDN